MQITSYTTSFDHTANEGLIRWKLFSKTSVIAAPWTGVKKILFRTRNQREISAYEHLINISSYFAHSQDSPGLRAGERVGATGRIVFGSGFHAGRVTTMVRFCQAKATQDLSTSWEGRGGTGKKNRSSVTHHWPLLVNHLTCDSSSSFYFWTINHKLPDNRPKVVSASYPAWGGTSVSAPLCHRHWLGAWLVTTAHSWLSDSHCPLSPLLWQSNHRPHSLSQHSHNLDVKTQKEVIFSVIKHRM